MRDFLPDDVRRRAFVIGVIADVYQRYGFEPLETPAVENIETLLGKYGEEGDRLIFKILKRGEEGRQTGETDLALRYDLTVPLARVVAEYQGKLPKFFKRYQIQPVWRADRPQKGRFREFYQCDVDAIGSTSPVVEAELLAAVSDVLEQLKFRDFTIRLNHRQLLTALLNAAMVPPTLHGRFLVSIDKFDKIGLDGVIEDLLRQGIDPGVASGAANRLFNWRGAAYSPDFMYRVEEVLGVSASEPCVANLQEVLRLSENTSAGQHIRVEPSLARGLSYYTGAIFEVAVPDLAGSLGGGGRYDNLVGMFSGQSVPACGFSLGLERILVVMGERGMFPPEVAVSGPDVLVTLWNDQAAGESLALARDLRSAGLRVEVYPEADKIGKQLKYASARGARFVTIVGDDERAKGAANVKQLATGDQQTIPVSDLGAWLRARL